MKPIEQSTPTAGERGRQRRFATASMQAGRNKNEVVKRTVNPEFLTVQGKPGGGKSTVPQHGGVTMSQSVSMNDIRQLSVAERLQLVEEIRDSISDGPDAWTLSAAQREELERRAAAHRANPDEGSSWAEVKASLRGTRFCV